MAEQIDGRKLAKISNSGTRAIINELGFKPHLAILSFLSGKTVLNHIMQIHNRRIIKTAEKTGIKVSTIQYPENVSWKTLKSNIMHLNENLQIDAILLQTPIPKRLDNIKLYNSIYPSKDVNGVNSLNLGYLLSDIDRSKFFYPINYTADSIIRILDYRYMHSHYGHILDNKGYTSHEILGGLYHGLRVTVIGNLHGAGKVLSVILNNRNSEVISVNKYARSINRDSNNIPYRYTQYSNVIVSATGHSGLIVPSNIHMNGPILIDAGEHMITGGIFNGDMTDEANVKSLAYTPVPGGVTPMAIATLARETAELAGDAKGSAYDRIFIK